MYAFRRLLKVNFSIKSHALPYAEKIILFFLRMAKHGYKKVRISCFKAFFVIILEFNFIANKNKKGLAKTLQEILDIRFYRGKRQQEREALSIWIF